MEGMMGWEIIIQILEEITSTQGNRHNTDNNLFIQVEEESLAVKNKEAEGDLMRTFWNQVLQGVKWLGHQGCYH